MDTTIFLSKLMGPVLLLRGASILIDRKHFLAMLEGLEAETKTVAFSMVPIGILMACISILVLHRDTGSVAGLLIYGVAIGGTIKASLLILFPGMVAAKARMVGKSGFIHVVWFVCLLVGGYFTWCGYFR